MRKLLCYLIVTLIHCTTYSQTTSINGVLVDSSQVNPISNAKIILVNLENNVIQTHTTSSKDGSFSLGNFSLTTFRLIVQHPKYETRDFFFIEETPQESYSLTNTVLQEKGKVIEGFTVYAYKDPVYYRGDTLVYIADSFKTRENAVVEDLLKKLPGVTVGQDGSIKSQGRDVSRVYVDGEEFFGSDATLATKNLPANSIKTVEIYEKRLDESSASDEKVQILDLKLKDEAKKGYFGVAEFGTDFNRFYEGKTLANYFNKDLKISGYLLSANTSRSLISWQESNEFNVENSRAYEYDSETDSWTRNSSFVETNDGFPLLFKTGVFYSQQVSKKLKLGANYTYSDIRKNTEVYTNSLTVLPDTTFINRSMKNDFIHGKNHQINLSMEYQLDSLQKITIVPKFSFGSVETSSNNLGQFIRQDSTNARQTFNTSNSMQDGLNMKTRVDYEKKFMKDKRILNITNNVTVDNNVNERSQEYSDYFNDLGTYSNQLHLNRVNDSKTFSNLFSTVFIEPIGKKTKLQFRYDLFSSRMKRDIGTNNLLTNQLDSLTSGDFTTDKIQHRLGVNYIYETKKQNFTIGLTGRQVSMNNTNHYTSSTLKINTVDLMPYLFYKYNFSTYKSLGFSTRTSSELPGINFLQPVLDNSNPNFIFKGNEALKPSYSIDSRLYFYSYNAVKGTNVFAQLSNRYTVNNFISTMEYDSLGRSVTSYLNGPIWSPASAYVSANLPILKQVLSLEPHFNAYYSEFHSYVNNQKNVMKSSHANIGLDLNLYTDVIDFEVGAEYSLTHAQNSLNTNLSMLNSVYGANSNMTIYLPWKMELELDYKFINRANMAEGFNIKQHILNASITQKLGKHQQFGIALQANDIFNQNLLISRTNYLNYTLDTRTSVIARYFMLNLSYKFNSMYKLKGNTPANEEE